MIRFWNTLWRQKGATPKVWRELFGDQDGAKSALKIESDFRLFFVPLQVPEVAKMDGKRGTEVD